MHHRRGYFYMLVWTLVGASWSHALPSPGCKNSEVLCLSDGVCVPEEKLCDGNLDCIDGTDEATPLCLSRPCRSDLDILSGLLGSLKANFEGFTFRCGNGACVAAAFVCDGKRHCLDGSDETQQLCSKQRCPKDKFRCAYGACVNKMDRCNGVVDCTDGSDETAQLCQRLRLKCPRNYFRCDYGACIFYRKKCNGKADCADESDESVATCGSNVSNPLTNSKVAPITISSTSTPTAPAQHPPTVTSTTTAMPASATATSEVQSSNTTITAAFFATTLTPTSEIAALSSASSEPLLKPDSEDLMPTHPMPQTPTEGTVVTSSTRFPVTAPPDTSLYLSPEAANFSTKVDDLASSHSAVPLTTTTDEGADQRESAPEIVLQQVPSSSSCSVNECLCPPPNQVCVFCTINSDLHDICRRQVMFCSSVRRAKNVEVELLSCGSFGQSLNVPDDSLRVASPPLLSDCEIDEGVPAKTLILVECWETSMEVFSCEEDARWHPIGVKDSTDSHALQELCQPSYLNPKVCGKLPRARPGAEHTNFQWPFLVGVFIGEEFLCGGTLIARQWVLTVASCLRKNSSRSSTVKEPEEVKLSLRIQHALWKPDEDMPKVFSVFLHPVSSGSSSSSSQLHERLALLKLELPLVLSEELVPACFNACEGKNGRSFAPVAAVFSHKPSGRRTKWIMRANRLEQSCFDPGNICSLLSREQELFCAKPLDESDLGNRDSLGSPYLVNKGSEHDERWTIVGVRARLHHWPGCQKRSVFMSVCAGREWIKNCVNENKCF